MRLNLQQHIEMTDEERLRRTQFFHSLFIVQVVGLAIFAVLGSIGQPTLTDLIKVNGPCALAIALLFVGRGFVLRGAFPVGVVVTLAVLTVSLIYFAAYYGVRSPLTFIAVWPIMVSSILLGPMAGFLVALLFGLILFGLTAIELNQLLSFPFFDGDPAYSQDWHQSDDPAVVTGVFLDTTTTTVVYFIMAYFSWLTSRSVKAAVVRSQEMIEELQGVADHNAAIASKINTASSRLSAWLKEQQQGAWAQSEAVQKIAESVRNLLESSTEISRRSEGVAKTAETSLENDEQIVESIKALSTHTKRIGELLAVMKDIANKSDILALNAALEGVKAGERGEGFVIVAARIQVMAEDVVGSLTHIKTIIEDIRVASEEAIASTYQGTGLTKHTAALTQQISSITTLQKDGTERVSQAIQEIEEVARQTVVATTEVLQAMSGLVDLSTEIRGLSDDNEAPLFSVVEDDLVAFHEAECTDESATDDD